MMSAATAIPESAAAIMAHPGFGHLKRKIIATTGLQYYSDKDSVLAEHVAHRQRALGCDTTGYFMRVLHADTTDEFSSLVDEITIGETYFFRYPEQFDAIRQFLIPNRMSDRQHDRTLRVWSAGCASGAEPYSLSIVCRRDLADLLNGWRVSILATDINQKALNQARVGEFTNWDLRTMTEEAKHRCFRPHGKNWIILPEYRQGLQFERQNLVADLESFTKTHAGLFDIILCRNVMIYFAPDLIRKVIQSCRECLASGGWLIVGHAEPYLEIANFLAPLSIAGVTVYQKDDDTPSLRATQQDWLARSWPTIAEADGVSSARDAIPLDSTSRAERYELGAESFPQMVSDAATDRASGDDAQMAGASTTAMSADAYLGDILRHIGAGEWNAACGICRQAIGRHSLDPRLYYVYALISEHLGAEAEAEQTLGRAIYLDRNFPLAHYHLGRCQAHRGARAAAARSFANALRSIETSDDHGTLAMGDGLTVADLREITQLQLDLLKKPAQ